MQIRFRSSRNLCTAPKDPNEPGRCGSVIRSSHDCSCHAWHSILVTSVTPLLASHDTRTLFSRLFATICIFCNFCLLFGRPKPIIPSDAAQRKKNRWNEHHVKVKIHKPADGCFVASCFVKESVMSDWPQDDMGNYCINNKVKIAAKKIVRPLVRVNVCCSPKEKSDFVDHQKNRSECPSCPRPGRTISISEHAVRTTITASICRAVRCRWRIIN